MVDESFTPLKRREFSRSSDVQVDVDKKLQEIEVQLTKAKETLVWLGRGRNSNSETSHYSGRQAGELARNEVKRLEQEKAQLQRRFTRRVMSNFVGRLETSAQDTSEKEQRKESIHIEPYVSERFTQEKLQPKIEHDQAGRERIIYSWNGKTFCFKSKEELPIYPTTNNSTVIVVGEQPLVTDQDQWTTWKNTVTTKGDEMQLNTHFIVDRSLRGICELGLHLGTLQPYRMTYLRQIIQELDTKKFTENTFHLMDQTMAGRFIDENGNVRSDSSDADAMLLLSLLGINEATDILEKRLTLFQEKRASSKALSFPEVDASVEALQLKNLCCLHATKYDPEKIAEHTYAIQSTADALNWAVLRDTVHTTLNHKVEGHMLGNWDSADIVLISSMESMIEENGAPTNLNTVDTYWSLNPGEKLVFANAILVKSREQKILIQTSEDNREVTFKLGNHQVKDWKEMTDVMKLDDGGERELEFWLMKFDDVVINSLNYVPWAEYLPSGVSDESQAFQTVLTKLLPYVFHENHRVFTPHLYKLLVDQADDSLSLTESMNMLIENSGILENLDEEKRDSFVKDGLPILVSKVEGFLKGTLSNLATKKAIKISGYTVQPGGMWSWGDSHEVTQKTVKLAQELGSESGAHVGSASAVLTDLHLRALGEATHEGKFDWSRYHLDITRGTEDENLPLLITQADLRTLYLSGAQF